MNTTHANQEFRATKIFLILFYLIVFVYDFFYFYLIPYYLDDSPVNIEGYGIGIYYYVLLIIILPISIYFYKINRVELIKYLYLLTYIVVILISDVIYYYQMDRVYASGPAIELFLILICPIFVNKRFYWFVTLGIITKYALVGLIIMDTEVLFPIALFSLLAALSYLILSRFKQYVDSVKKSFDVQLIGIVKGIVTTLELKDPYTRGHSERVAKYAEIIARNLNYFSEEELKLYYYACLLHDVGKVNIPDQILMKPGKLTSDEYEVIKTHPVIGAEAIKGIEGFEESIDVIKYHHERWDGKGYPEQLKGEEIPLLARITAIADAYDAMTSTRSYRPALTSDIAYQNIIEGDSTQFDPELVDVFKQVYPEFLNIQIKNMENVMEVK